MNTELKNAVKATDKDAQYDESAKRLLGQKSILAHILTKTVDEFRGMEYRKSSSMWRRKRMIRAAMRF